MGNGGGGEGADVFGDAPNVAARVQAAAEPDSVMITAAVQELVAGRFVLEERGAHQLKGIEHPVFYPSELMFLIGPPIVAAALVTAARAWNGPERMEDAPPEQMAARPRPETGKHGAESEGAAAPTTGEPDIR